MANQIIGKIYMIGNTQSYESKGKTYQNRELILDTTKIDQYTGERQYESYAQLEFSGERCAELDKFKVGDIVIVSFDLRAMPYEKNGEKKWFSHVAGYKIEYRLTRREDHQIDSSNVEPVNTDEQPVSDHNPTQTRQNNNQPNGEQQQPSFDDGLPF